MKKYIIIESCKACPLRTYDHPDNRFYCSENGLMVPYHGAGKDRRGFPTWCPLDNQHPNQATAADACKCDTDCIGWLDTKKGRLCSVCGELRR